MGDDRTHEPHGRSGGGDVAVGGAHPDLMILIFSSSHFCSRVRKEGIAILSTNDEPTNHRRSIPSGGNSWSTLDDSTIFTANTYLMRHHFTW